MSRAVEIPVAAALVAVYWPAMLFVQYALAVGDDAVKRRLRRANLDNIPLLWRVLQGRLTIGEWARIVFRQ